MSRRGGDVWRPDERAAESAEAADTAHDLETRVSWTGSDTCPGVRAQAGDDASHRLGDLGGNVEGNSDRLVIETIAQVERLAAILRHAATPGGYTSRVQ